MLLIEIRPCLSIACIVLMPPENMLPVRRLSRSAALGAWILWGDEKIQNAIARWTLLHVSQAGLGIRNLNLGEQMLQG
ncbi:MAG TPA: hypothetical protein DCL95_00125 [Rhodospirillaceae bacterium]|nr:hypothetical protein [Rhodospirillaceae bacterium]